MVGLYLFWNSTILAKALHKIMSGKQVAILIILPCEMLCDSTSSTCHDMYVWATKWFKIVANTEKTIQFSQREMGGESRVWKMEVIEKEYCNWCCECFAIHSHVIYGSKYWVFTFRKPWQEHRQTLGVSVKWLDYLAVAEGWALITACKFGDLLNKEMLSYPERYCFTTLICAVLYGKDVRSGTCLFVCVCFLLVTHCTGCPRSWLSSVAWSW